jgi:hypothetical protein
MPPDAEKNRIENFLRLGYLEREGPLILANAKEVTPAPDKDELRGSCELQAKPFYVASAMRLAFEAFRWQKVAYLQV